MVTTAKKTDLVVLLHDMAQYNDWANTQLITWLNTKPDALLEQVVPSSFPSIRATLLHLRAAEAFWLGFLRQAPAAFGWDTPFAGSFAVLGAGLVAHSGEVKQYVQSLDDDSLAAACHLDTPWMQGTRSRAEFLHHLFNHSTYHRGQVVTIGHHLGLTDAPMTDYTVYTFFGKPAEVPLAA